jgi:4-diphosphocytidyl-2-C-methyl-D-erythritol kinase
VQLRRVADGVVVDTPAKLNLFFEILARRSDGFHEIETLMAPLSVYDTLEFRDLGPAKAGSEAAVALDCGWGSGLVKRARRANGLSGRADLESGEAGAGGQRGETSDLEELPTGIDNIAVRAVELLRRRAGVERNGAIRLTKRIPSAAGLGGGSSDAAAALAAANAAWNLGWTRERLLPLGAELGSDVPFFLHRGPAICRGRGEKVTPVRRFGVLFVVVVRPPQGLRTAAVYQLSRPRESAALGGPAATAVHERLLSRDWRRLEIYNALTPAARQLSPWVERLQREFAGTGCLADGMSGSGSSWFGVCRSARHARCVSGRLRSRQLGRVFTAACG